MVDRARLLAQLDELDGYLGELRSVVPARFEDYLKTEKKRASERLIQVSVEAVLDVCGLLVTGLRLGLPGDADDLFEKLARRGVISASTALTLKRMRGLRNLLVHEYGRVDDRVVFETVSRRLEDFQTFKAEVLGFLRREGPP